MGLTICGTLPSNMYASANNAACYNEVLLVTKRTFIEFRWPEDEERASLRRNKSEPSLLWPSVTPCAKGLSELMEAPTPTTCASENGDDDGDSVSFPNEFPECQIVSNSCFTISSTCSNHWADVTDCDTLSVTSGSLESNGDRKEGEKKKRYSGRARQREKRRQRMRTPSPSRC